MTEYLQAVLHYLLTAKKPKVLFITHYPLIAAEFAEEVCIEVFWFGGD